MEEIRNGMREVCRKEGVREQEEKAQGGKSVQKKVGHSKNGTQ